MKNKLLGLGLLLAAAGLAAAGLAAAGLAAQTADPNQPLLGRGRGGAPYAWNDKDKDGICDITGRPVGQGWRAVWRAQKPEDAATPLLGRGRGGAPYAWNDKDKDGICDITGRPVGQGFGGGRGRGRGWRAANAAQSGATAPTQQ
ncbi:MAG: hypothetical protein K6T61_07485 [Bryobacteraceae bacterium]|nr:hypothetical protein [Bryobacteraceae bacterium]